MLVLTLWSPHQCTGMVSDCLVDPTLEELELRHVYTRANL